MVKMFVFGIYKFMKVHEFTYFEKLIISIWTFHLSGTLSGQLENVEFIRLVLSGQK